MEPVTVGGTAPMAELLPTRRGRMVLLRPVRASDAALLGAFIERLSPAARRWRFHGSVKVLPQGLLQRMTQPDLRLEAVLLAVAIVAGEPLCVGEARYALGEGAPDSREFALVVDDAWQGEGLGATLLRSLTRHAQRQGVRHLVGEVLRDNAVMIELAQRSGYALLAHPADPRLLRVTRALGGAQRDAAPRWIARDVHAAADMASRPMNGPR